MTTNSNLMLITGGTGTTGRRVVDRLTTLGLPVRLGSRSGAPPCDWHDESTWGPVLAGVDVAYLAFSPEFIRYGTVALPAPEVGEPFVDVEDIADVVVAGLTARGVPAEEAEVFADIFVTVLDGRNAHPTDGVQRALGRPPTDFADYARAAAATGVCDR